jgi:hypothetical protein
MWLIISVILALGGCTPDGTDSSLATPAADQNSLMPSATRQPTPAPVVTPSPAPIATTPPDIEASAPELTPTYEPQPSPEATPAPEKESGRVELADGFYYIRLSDEIRKRITGISYPKDDKGIGISYDDLRYIRIRHYDFEGAVHDGELIVHKKLANEVMEIFYELYKAEYPLVSVRLVDDFGQPGDDTLSMEANNTSAFCYRRVTGSKTLSRHSLGAAIDINPVMNPYIDGDRVAPENGAKYVDRSLRLPGMIDHDDLCYKLFKKHGWSWGGDWKGDKDYQHFSKNVG